jgi:hypothetical protein
MSEANEGTKNENHFAPWRFSEKIKNKIVELNLKAVLQIENKLCHLKNQHYGNL